MRRMIGLAILGIAMTAVVACSGAGIFNIDSATATPTVVERFLAQTSPLLERFGPIDSAVAAAMTSESLIAASPWPDGSTDEPVTQAEAVSPGRAEFRSLDSMTAEEITKALNTHPAPFIPIPYRNALEELVDELELAIENLDLLTADWQLLEPPPLAVSWHNQQSTHFSATRRTYEQLLANRSSILERGFTTTDAKQEAILRLLTEQQALDAAVREFEKLRLK